MFVKGKYRDYDASVTWKCPHCGKTNIIDFVEDFGIEIEEKQTVIYTEATCKYCGKKSKITT